MNRNFIFNARKQGDSARNSNLRCGLGAYERGFGTYCDPGVGRYGHLSGASCDDLNARIDGLFRGIGRYDLDARRRELLRGSGCIDVGAGRHSLLQDTGHCGFITPKYELRSRANCDYSVSVLLNGVVCCGFTARNLAQFSSDIYCGSSASACLRRVGANRDTFLRCGFDTCGFSAKCSTQKTILGACHSLFCDASGLGSEQNPTLGTFCAVQNFLNLHVARDFKNFSPVNLKKFNLAASQFVNLKKQIRAGEGAKKSAGPYNLTSFGRETRTPGRLGPENKIPAPRRFYFESAVGAPCGSGLRHRGCEVAQNFKRFAPDFAENFKDFTWSLETEPAQNFKISALNFIQNFWNSTRGREVGSMQGFGNSGRNFEPKFPQSAKNSDRNLETELARDFKNQNSTQDFSQNGKSYDQNSTQGFLQSGRSTEPNSEASFSQSIKNSERNLLLSFLQSVKSSDQSQNSKPTSAQSFKNQNFAWDFSQNGRSAEPSSVQNFSQSAKNSDRNSKANSTQSHAEPVSPQGSKNSESCPAQRQELGFYAPKFKDERARNFFSHPMRAFVLFACFFAALGALSFLAPDALAIDYVSAHKFYFLFLAPSCIYAAFLLTALPDWTNFEGSLKPVSLAFAACLIAAFIASFLNLRLAAAITALFWAIFFIFAALLLWLDKNSNNFSILAVLAAFCACSAAYGASGDEKFLLSFVHINVAAIAVVSYRISVVIGNEALREAGLSDAVFIPNFIYKNLAAFLSFALALATPFLSEAACGFIALGIGFLFLAKLRELHYVEILSRHYMAFYYALQAACAAGYLWLGAALIRGGYAAAPLHVIAICYMYGAILFVGMIAGQRHSGISPLNFPRLSRAALVLALLAGALRAVFAGESFILYVMIPSALFIAAVALYLINFVPIFLKNPFSADPD
ncbi:NnrS family protein [uncultured Campylobacter sp.]|uniref:NnrS family protein n=1 Tax=uncultured Campylobacter sp. TaxID=218934 RepID=UPI0026048942|nr:NnrS family protein [uncultured Campylobacter sp.]